MDPPSCSRFIKTGEFNTKSVEAQAKSHLLGPAVTAALTTSRTCASNGRRVRLVCVGEPSNGSVQG